MVPAHPNQQAHMAMLLNQQPGKLMLNDIQVKLEAMTACSVKISCLVHSSVSLVSMSVVRKP